MASLMRQRRATIDVDINAASKKVSTWHSKVFAKPPTLLNHDQVPAYCQDNPYILSGYRPISNSFSACWSSWLYLHNESLNIYTHLIPAVAFLATEAVMVTYLDSFYPDASAKDHLVFGFFLATSVTCMIASATYHTVMSHSHEVENLFLRFDFVGIVVQILGNFVSGVYMGFYCEPQLQKLYWTMVLSLGGASVVALVSPNFQGAAWRWLRVSLFVGTGMSGLIPLAHGVMAFGMQKMMLYSGMPFYLLEGLLYLVGTFFYVTRMPESLWPGKFDIWGSSHQLFHIIVVLATITHFAGLLCAFDYNYHQRRCGLETGFGL